MKPRTVASLLVVMPTIAFAHHSRLFLRTTTYDLGHPFQWEFIGNAALSHFSDGNAYELEPGLFVAPSARADWGFELHGHFESEPGEAVAFEASAVEARHRLTFDPGTNYAVGLEYEKNPGSSEPGNWQFQLIAGEEGPERAWMANILAQMTNAAHEQLHFGYSVAVGRIAHQNMGYAMELTGDIASNGSHELTPEVSWAFGDKALVKVGVGIGLTKDSPDYSLRVGFSSKLN